MPLYSSTFIDKSKFGDKTFHKTSPNLNRCMSADPKSLATLAISTSKQKHKQSEKQISDECETRSKSGDIKKFRSTDEFIAGWSAACINTTILFPVNKLIFRQMAGGHGAYVAADQMKEEGEHSSINM